LLHYA